MKITVLVENSIPCGWLSARHGLSLYAETANHRIVFDMGPDESLLENSNKLGIDVSTADIAFVSHGHYDHGGGLPCFLEHNDIAPVYIAETAFEPHFANGARGRKDIGLDASLKQNDRFVLVGEKLRIDDELCLFSHVSMDEYVPKSNRTLFTSIGGEDRPDAFEHEQSLLIEENGEYTLITGCSHCGIVNIIKKAEAIIGTPLHAVVAGFHLMNPGDGSVEDLDTALLIASFMKERPTRYCTFHCTGLAAFSVLRDVLGDQITYLYTGSSIEL